jgi:hypothetical protein
MFFWRYLGTGTQLNANFYYPDPGCIFFYMLILDLDIMNSGSQLRQLFVQYMYIIY